MNLSPILFWDTDYNSIDWKKSRRYVISRVVQFGTLLDWNAIKAFYGIEVIKTEMLMERDLDNKSLAFLSCVLDIPQEQFRCYTFKQSHPQHSIY